MNEIKREREVNHQMGELDSVISDTSSLLGEMESRLAGVTRLEPPCAPDKGTDLEQLVPLADGLRGFVMRIENSNGRIRSILDRLEL
jgi:hypothetical protein